MTEHKKKILLVDDEQDFLFAIKLTLEANHFDVTTASDGQEALDKAYKEKPHLIILDLMLPKLDGFKVCRMLKFNENFKKVPIILLTARVHEEDEEVGYGVGADAYLRKSADPEVLVRKIKQLL